MNVKVLRYWTTHLLPLALPFDPGWVWEAEAGTIGENSVFESACFVMELTVCLSFSVFFSFLTMSGTNSKFTWRS